MVPLDSIVFAEGELVFIVAAKTTAWFVQSMKLKPPN